MTIIRLFDLLLDKNIDLKLIGDICCDDETIKCEYDGLGKTNEDMETHLMDVYEIDRETLTDYFMDINASESFFIQEPEIADSFIAFQISEE